MLEKSEFIYSGNDYDNEGLFYYFGCNKGAQDWENPCNGKYLKVNASSILYGTLADLTKNEVSHFSTQNLINEQFVSFQILEGIKFLPTSYTIGYTKQGKEIKLGIPRNWSFEASHDGTDWFILRTHNNDEVLKYNRLSFTHKIDAAEFYSFFRIRQTGSNSEGNNSLALSGIELYGILINEELF